MTADPLADLLHDEFHGGDDADDLWVDWKNDVSRAQADAIRAALRDGTLSPEDLGMVAVEEGHWLCTDRASNGSYCSPEDPHPRGYCQWVGTSYRVPKEAPHA